MGKTSLYGWVIDDQSARIDGYRPDESAFVIISLFVNRAQPTYSRFRLHGLSSFHSWGC